MKLALDIWYELWEKTGSEGSTNPNSQPDEQDGHYPWRQDYSPWIGGKETRAETPFPRKGVVNRTTRVDDEMALAWLGIEERLRRSCRSPKKQY